MSYLDTKHKRKSVTLTAIIAIVILLLIFNFGMRYFDPPKEYGIAVNFGTTDFGSGNVQPTEALKPVEQELQAEEIEEEVVEQEIVEEQVETSSATSETAENVITQDNEEAIAIKKQEEAKRKEEDKKQKEIDRKAEVERQKIVAEKKRIEKEKQEKAAKRKQLDALMGGFSNGNGNATGGEGDDNQPGDKGKVTGDPNVSGYYGNGGGGSGGNYRLGNRKALSIPDPKDDCINEFGKVLINIQVDRTGKVIEASLRLKGANSTSPCLVKRAKEAALNSKFNVDNKAPLKQAGYIIYNFS
ncbi:MAG: energy transducer TonB, partial [Flavobacteriaceae bacterium]|nr:energy transducer TonB [Flavobacteriaceae bacterium]